MIKKISCLFLVSILFVSLIFNSYLILAQENDSNSQRTRIEIQKNGRTITAEAKNESVAERIKESLQERNRLRFENRVGVECPEECDCVGVTIQCRIGEGERRMTVYAQSGNIIIIESKGTNATTNATLYHHEGKVFGIFEDDTANEINFMPDEVRERVRERTRARIHNEEIELDEKGKYRYEAEKEARFLGLFKVREKIMFKIDPTTGNILSEKSPWWSFLTIDIKETE